MISIPNDTALACRIVAGIVLVEAQAEGQQGFLAFDTGAMQTGLNTKYFSGLSGKAREVAKFSGGLQDASAMDAVAERIAFSGVSVEDWPVLLMDFSYVEDSLRPLFPELRFLGTLGIDIIRSFSVLMDYPKERLVLDPAAPGRPALEVPLELGDLPVVEVTIDGAAYSFVLDTGANTCLLGEELREKVHTAPSDTPGLMTIPSLAVQGRSFENVPAVFSDLAALQEKVAVQGVIGFSILSPQVSLLDLPKGTLSFLEPQ